MDSSGILAISIIVLALAVILFRIVNLRRLNSRNASDRSLKILYIVGLTIVLLFVVSEVLLQTHII
jgi:ABC-type nickel/cobalt efflux system permease component RcnA